MQDERSRACASGAQQSPIDIVETMRAQLAPLKFNWSRGADTIANTGRTIEVNFRDGSKLDIGKQRYSLLQFHFHHPSEHRIGGNGFPMEAHFVHRTDAGFLAVLAVMLTAGRANRTFSRIVATMPAQEGPAIEADSGIDANALLPARRHYFRYFGSLTTPPCAEVVDWFVLAEPVSVARSDIAAFAKLYPMNARPARRDPRRYVLRSA
jgi:carbonic anhydrase